MIIWPSRVWHEITIMHQGTGKYFSRPVTQADKIRRLEEEKKLGQAGVISEE